jgi:hypothetical protein
MLTTFAPWSSVLEQRQKNFAVSTEVLELGYNFLKAGEIQNHHDTAARFAK